MRNTAEVNERLAPFVGGSARLMSYTASHDRLSIELQDAQRTQRKYLMLLGCVDIQLRAGWQVQDLRIEKTASGFALVDEGVRVAFEYEVQIVDNFEP